jgi:hypothetical protein
LIREIKMGKHLTIEEKHNASKELEENREKIKALREQINALKYRNKRLENYLHNVKHISQYGGLFYENGDMYKQFGKKKSDLTVEELREYNKVKQRESRERRRNEVSSII